MGRVRDGELLPNHGHDLRNPFPWNNDLSILLRFRVRFNNVDSSAPARSGVRGCLRVKMKKNEGVRIGAVKKGGVRINVEKKREDGMAAILSLSPNLHFFTIFLLKCWLLAFCYGLHLFVVIFPIFFITCSNKGLAALAVHYKWKQPGHSHLFPEVEAAECSAPLL